MHAVTTGLGVGEGIETALTLAKEITPVWSLLTAGELAELPYLHPLECLTVAIDNDEAGINAFNAVAERWSSQGAEVIGLQAKQTGSDLNDSQKVYRYA